MTLSTITRRMATLLCAALALGVLSPLLAHPLSAQNAPTGMVGAPDRGDDGDGPFDRLIIRGATVIDGTGAPPIGPMDIVVEGNRIVDVRSVGVPGVDISATGRPELGEGSAVNMRAGMGG